MASLKIKALTSAVIAGLLRPFGLADINVVSAPSIAAQRGIVIEEVTRAAQSDYESFITLSVTTAKMERSLGGTAFTTASLGSSRSKASRSTGEFSALDDLCDQRRQTRFHRPVWRKLERNRFNEEASRTRSEMCWIDNHY